MAVFVAVNFLAMRIFARVNNVITWWKVAVPVLAIIVLLTQWHTGNFTAGGVGFMPGGIKALFGALPAAGIIFAYSGFEQCDQLAGEIKNPGRNLPRAIIISVLIGTAIYCLLQVAFIVALPPGAARRPRWPDRPHLPEYGNVQSVHLATERRAVRGRRGPGRGGLAGAHPADRRLRLPVRHRADLHDRDVAGQLRPGQEPVLPADLRPGRAATASRGSG